MIIRNVKQLNNRKGMSIMYALVYLLVLTVLGGIVLTAASAAFEVSDRSKREQKNYFLVKSAARLIAQQLNGASAEITYQEEEMRIETIGKDANTGKESSSVELQGPYYKGEMSYKAGSVGDNVFSIPAQKTVQNRIQALFNRQLPEDKEYYQYEARPDDLETFDSEPIEISLVSSYKNEESVVSGKLEIDDNYRITVYVWSETNQGDSYRLKISVPATLRRYDGNTQIQSEEDKIEGTNETNNTDNAEENRSTRTTRCLTKKHTVITWGKAEIIKDY